jgi:hypothetical protein
MIPCRPIAQSHARELAGSAARDRRLLLKSSLDGLVLFLLRAAGAGERARQQVGDDSSERLRAWLTACRRPGRAMRKRKTAAVEVDQVDQREERRGPTKTLAREEEGAAYPRGSSRGKAGGESAEGDRLVSVSELCERWLDALTALSWNGTEGGAWSRGGLASGAVAGGQSEQGGKNAVRGELLLTGHCCCCCCCFRCCCCGRGSRPEACLGAGTCQASGLGCVCGGWKGGKGVRRGGGRG